MSASFLVWLAVGLVTTVAIIALVIALVRHAILLGRTIARLQHEIRPIADEITTEGRGASSRIARAAESSSGHS